MSSTLADLAARAGGRLVGDDAGAMSITGVAPPDSAVSGDIAYIAGEDAVAAIASTHASALLIDEQFAEARGTLPAIVCARPRLALAHVLAAFPPPPDAPATIHETALIHPSAHLAEGVGAGPYSVIAEDVTVGRGTRLGAFTYVGAESHIGDGCLVHPHVYIGPRTVLGRGVILHAGARIGTDGYGYAQDGPQHVKLEHIGRVVLDDGVEIGANSTVDRATMGETRIGAGTKVDNLVHIAHNCTIGRACLLVGQVGLSGSVTLGDGVVLAGQVGVADHVTIGDRAQVGAQSGVHRDIPAGARVLGTPPLPYRQEMRMIAHLLRLPELAKTVRELDTRMQAIESGQAP